MEINRKDIIITIAIQTGEDCTMVTFYCTINQFHQIGPPAIAHASLILEGAQKSNDDHLFDHEIIVFRSSLMLSGFFGFHRVQQLLLLLLGFRFCNFLFRNFLFVIFLFLKYVYRILNALLTDYLQLGFKEKTAEKKTFECVPRNCLR